MKTQTVYNKLIEKLKEIDPSGDRDNVVKKINNLRPNCRKERIKVEHALPAIDVRPPVQRGHVTCKLKKLQKEAERCARIEQDNFTLLQHLRSIMHSSRIDNVWQEAPPNFLHRVGIYCTTNGESSVSEPLEALQPPSNRKERCMACSPHRIDKKEKIPEVRVPWDPPRPTLSRRQGGSLLVNRETAKKKITQSTTEVQEIQLKKNSYALCSTTGNQNRKSRSRAHSAATSVKHGSKLPNKFSTKSLPSISTQSIILSHGALNLAVNFPPYATIVLKDGNKEKLIQSEFCECSAINKVTSRDSSAGNSV